MALIFTPVDEHRIGGIKLGTSFYILYKCILPMINIYAGINGLEAGQSVVNGLAIIAMNCLN